MIKIHICIFFIESCEIQRLEDVFVALNINLDNTDRESLLKIHFDSTSNERNRRVEFLHTVEILFTLNNKILFTNK